MGCSHPQSKCLGCFLKGKESLDVTSRHRSIGNCEAEWSCKDENLAVWFGETFWRFGKVFVSSQFFPWKWNVSLGKPEVLDGIVVAWNYDTSNAWFNSLHRLVKVDLLSTSLPPKAELCYFLNKTQLFSLAKTDLFCFVTTCCYWGVFWLQGNAWEETIESKYLKSLGTAKSGWVFMEKSPVQLLGLVRMITESSKCKYWHQRMCCWFVPSKRYRKRFVSWIFGNFPHLLAIPAAECLQNFSADIGHFNLSKGWHIQQRPECPVGLFCIGHTLDFRSFVSTEINLQFWPLTQTESKLDCTYRIQYD